MIFYLWDKYGLPAGSVERDENGPLPARSTRTKPPVPPAGSRVMWRGGWVTEPKPTPSLDERKHALREAVTALRWAKETGGIDLGGVQVGTTLQDQNRIASVLAAMTVSDFGDVDFKAQNGWVNLTAAQVQGIATAITAHVQSCFTAERLHHEAIDALTTVAAADAYDVTYGWPIDSPAGT